MKTLWTKGLETDSAAEMKLNFNSSALLRKRLAVLLEEMSEVKRKACLKENAYENANWGYMQADAVGYQRAIQDIVNILT